MDGMLSDFPSIRLAGAVGHRPREDSQPGLTLTLKRRPTGVAVRSPYAVRVPLPATIFPWSSSCRLDSKSGTPQEASTPPLLVIEPAASRHGLPTYA